MIISDQRAGLLLIFDIQLVENERFVSQKQKSAVPVSSIIELIWAVGNLE